MNAAFCVVDLGFGDAGKGRLVDALCRELAGTAQPRVVRWHGGAQAGHRVVEPNGRTHTFSQLGAGSFVNGALTLWGPQFVCHPGALAIELGRLSEKGVNDGLSRIRAHADCRVTTPYHQAANRLRERARGNQRHGSCGVGFGETVAWSLNHPEASLRLGDLLDLRRSREKVGQIRKGLATELAPLQEFDPDAYSLFADPRSETLFLGEACAMAHHLQILHSSDFLDFLAEDAPLIFEGAQGVLLDEWRGMHPHTTWSTATPEEPLRLTREIGRELRVLGVLRRFPTRHGAGPFPSETPALTAALPEADNREGPWQGVFRHGMPDLVLGAYAKAACEAAGQALDGLVMSWLDASPADSRAAVAWDVPEGRIESVPLGPSGSLSTTFTQRAATAQPHYAQLCPPGDSQRFAQAFAERLGLPLRGWFASEHHISGTLDLRT
jgi:adenylosuccinate synthase